MAKYNKYGREFYDLAIQVNETLIANDNLIGDQKEQVELVFKLENDFQKAIADHTQLNDIYKKFIHYIKNDNANILTAKPLMQRFHVLLRMRM